jgi:hypothetical protein
MGGEQADKTDWKGIQTGITNAATQQTQNNRLNTSNPFASQTFNPDGSTSTQFAGGLGNAATGLQQQAAGLARPMDWSQFGTVGTGDQARQQAIDAAYGSATSRLDPQWERRQNQEHQRLANQGLDPSSEAYKNAMSDFSTARNDAYNQANFSAIGQGTAAGDSAFRNNLMSQQNQIANALRQRGMPMQEMQQMMQLMGQPGYSQDNSTLGGAMGSAQLAKAAADQEFAAQQAKAAQEAGTAGGIMSGIGTAAGIAAMFF